MALFLMWWEYRVEKPTGEDWRRYYEAGARRRKAIGGDPIRLYQERELAKDRRALLVASV